MDPDQVLVNDAISDPHRVHTGLRYSEEDSIKALSAALKEMLRRELLTSGAAPIELDTGLLGDHYR